MKQVWIPKAGPPEVLEVRTAPDPQPQAGCVRIRVAASGVNFADIVGRMGLYPDLPPMPVVVGYEVAGKVDAVGAGVDAAWLGRDVVSLTRFGGYSDVVCVNTSMAFERPADMSVEMGAALPVNYLTAYQLVEVMGGLKAGETMLVHSAGGGVGIAAIQLAKRIGAQVIGTASAHKHEALRALGVDHLIDYTREDFEQRVHAITQGAGVELVLDAVGGASYTKSFRVLAPSGRLGMFGVSSLVTGKRKSVGALLRFAAQLPWLKFNPLTLMNSNKGVFGVNLGHMWHQQARLGRWMETLLGYWRAGAIRPVIARTFALDDTAAAHHFVQDRKNIGKVLLTTGA